jgi:hypothetical protein
MAALEHTNGELDDFFTRVRHQNISILRYWQRGKLCGVGFQFETLHVAGGKLAPVFALPALQKELLKIRKKRKRYESAKTQPPAAVEKQRERVGAFYRESSVGRAVGAADGCVHFTQVRHAPSSTKSNHSPLESVTFRASRQSDV